ncbi:MAG: DNA-deoxyinosine glycosylase [Methanoregulaceae archaeon]|nr:DNA-deoxyinosine glycosylase [Methanoregulaceae archaeon]
MAGLRPEIGPVPLVLIVGSFPGPLSLGLSSYYANPRNQFWEIMEVLLGIDKTLPYIERIRSLKDHHVALWDSVETCRREGALDSGIRNPVLNDIGGLIRNQSSIKMIGANGKVAGKFLFRALGRREDDSGSPILVTLPSTSPANSQVSLERKIDIWRDALAGFEGSPFMRKS